MKSIEELAEQETAYVERTLEEREAIIERGLGTFREVGNELAAIRNLGQYLEAGYTRFQDYLEERWGISRRRGYQLIDAAEIANSVCTVVHTDAPTSERVARELAPLKDDPEAMAAALTEAREKHGPDPTAEQVREFVRERPGMGVHYTSTTDEWSTPQELYDVLDREFGFELDVCATPLNAKCDRFFDRAQDGLSQPWEGVCWMNPPYGDRIVEWVAKAKHAAEEGAIVVCLVPARTDTAWFWDYCRWGEVRFLRGRLRFGGGGDSAAGAPFPSCVVVFGVAEDVKWWDWKGEG